MNLEYLVYGRHKSWNNSVTELSMGWATAAQVFGSGMGVGGFSSGFRRSKPSQIPIPWVPGAVSSGVKQPEREADHSLISEV